MERRTRSGREFSPWAVLARPVTAISPNCSFSFHEKLEVAFSIQDDDVIEHDDLELLSDPSDISTLLEAGGSKEAPSSQSCDTSNELDRLFDSSRSRKTFQRTERQKRRNIKRREMRAVDQLSRRDAVEKHRCKKALASHVKVSSGAPDPFSGLKQPYQGSMNQGSLDDLLNSGFQLVEWDGIQPRAVVSKEGAHYIHLAGRPVGGDFDQVIADLENEMSKAEKLSRFSTTQKHHRRGSYSAISAGISYGGGQTEPRRLRQYDENLPILDTLFMASSLVRLVGFINHCFKLHAPTLYQFYTYVLAEIVAWNPNLKTNFTNSAFAACTFNFGPRVSTVPHVDFLNLAWGWCAITALGKFDHKKGGHLILWDLHMVIEFPRGSTIFIPSAVITHSNLPIQPNETRMSFTQYTASGLFLWVAYGFKPKYIAENLKEEAASWWRAGTQMFSKVAQLTFT